ncbi:uncharacterized protein G2W53_029242 [Senna tora]|uniref:Uncharacterized protein n=1 Tax=Senna tora TaxID=362788 RepID=A0A834T2M4_9FABA|nr:uncharacterized protein G2W53_029242 [Senna tora]
MNPERMGMFIRQRWTEEQDEFLIERMQIEKEERGLRRYEQLLERAFKEKYPNENILAEKHIRSRIRVIKRWLMTNGQLFRMDHLNGREAELRPLFNVNADRVMENVNHINGVNVNVNDNEEKDVNANEENEPDVNANEA